MKRQHYQRGSVYLDARRKVWVYRWKDHSTGARRSERLGTLAEIPTKAKALRLASGFVPTANPTHKMPIVTFETAARRYIGRAYTKAIYDEGRISPLRRRSLKHGAIDSVHVVNPFKPD